MESTYNIQEIRSKDYKYSRIIQDLLKKNNWKSTTQQATYSDKNSKSKIKTYLDGTDTIFYKHKLAERFKKYSFINPFYRIDQDNRSTDLLQLPDTIDHNSIWFLKASDLLVGAGEEIDVLKFQQGDEFRRKIEEIIKPQYSYILQKNIDPPLLYNGYKFDLRLIGVIVYTPKEFATYILDKANIKYAMSQYSTEYNDAMNLKLSLMTSVGNVKRMSEAERKNLNPNPTGMFDASHKYYHYLHNIINVYSCIIKCIYNDIQKIRNNNISLQNDSGFIIISIDAMMNETGCVNIIEINSHPSLYNDSSSLDAAYNYKYHHGLNHEIFRHFYELVFNSILKNKLITSNYNNWIITNHYNWQNKIKCRDRIIRRQADIGLYKFSLTRRDIKRFVHFVNRQPLDYIAKWGVISDSEIVNIIGENYGSSEVQFGIVDLINKRIIGLIGFAYRSDKYKGEFKNNYFTNILIDKEMSGKGYATTVYKIFIKWIERQVQKKVYNMTKIYASIYKDNKSSIGLHEKVGFRYVGHGTTKTIIYEYTL